MGYKRKNKCELQISLFLALFFNKQRKGRFLFYIKMGSSWGDGALILLTRVDTKMLGKS